MRTEEVCLENTGGFNPQQWPAILDEVLNFCPSQLTGYIPHSSSVSQIHIRTMCMSENVLCMYTKVHENRHSCWMAKCVSSKTDFGPTIMYNYNPLINALIKK